MRERIQGFLQALLEKEVTSFLGPRRSQRWRLGDAPPGTGPRSRPARCSASGYEARRGRDLSGRELVYLWADGLYVEAGLEREKAALLIVIGAMRDGTKEVLAVESGVRESTEAWKAVLRSLRERGLRSHRLTIADGHLGIWGALAEIYPESAEQRCWNHKVPNVLDQLPRGEQPRARERCAGWPTPRPGPNVSACGGSSLHATGAGTRRPSRPSSGTGSGW